MNIERWDTFEVAFNALRAYDNPFQDVELTGIFTHKETGRIITVNGFYDGDSTWRIRFMPNELGLWSYITKSSSRRIVNTKQASYLLFKV